MNQTRTASEMLAQIENGFFRKTNIAKASRLAGDERSTSHGDCPRVRYIFDRMERLTILICIGSSYPVENIC